MYEGENILISSQKSPADVSRENIFYGELEKHLHGGVCIPMHSDSQQCARTLGPITVYTNLSLTLVAQNYFTNFRHLHPNSIGRCIDLTVFENIVCDIVSREFPELYHYRCT